jgi:hypothetical protein
MYCVKVIVNKQYRTHKNVFLLLIFCFLRCNLSIQQGVRIFSKTSTVLRYTQSLNGYRDLFRGVESGRRLRLTTYLHVVSLLRMCG